MSLASYLTRSGIVSGPISFPTGHTRLGFVKSVLLGREVSTNIPKTYQEFGKYVHESLFLGSTSIKLSDEDKANADKMLATLRKNATVMKMIQGAVCEVTEKLVIDGVRIEYTPDAVQHKKKGRDLKTTSCTTEKDFIEKAFGYGYFRQAVLYSRAAGLNEFVIIGITKKKPFKVFIVVTSMHKDYLSYAKQELDFLLYFYKHYGNFNILIKQQHEKDNANKKDDSKKKRATKYASRN